MTPALASARTATTDHAPVLEIRVAGDLDALTGPDLRRRVLEAGELGYSVAIDLAGVPSMDAAGLAAIIGPRRRLRAMGLDVTIHNATAPGVRRTLAVTRFAPLFDLGGRA